MEKIKNFFKKVWIFLNSKVFLYLLIIIAILSVLNLCSSNRDLKINKTINEQNIIALQDTIKTERTKNGRLQYSISSYISNINDLENLNESLYNEVKNQKGQIFSLTQTNVKLKQDYNTLKESYDDLKSLFGKPIQINDTTYKIPWKIAYNFNKSSSSIYYGATTISTTIDPGFILTEGVFDNKSLIDALIIEHIKSEMDSIETNIKLVFGHKIEDGNLRVFIESDYPGFSTETLEGVLIDPNTIPYLKKLMKKRQWIPNTFTLGIGITSGYDIFGKNPYLGIGITLNYNLYQW